MTVVCLVILAGIFWGDFFLKNYIESHGRAGRTQSSVAEKSL